jgi:hypothetical protein
MIPTGIAVTSGVIAAALLATAWADNAGATVLLGEGTSVAVELPLPGVTTTRVHEPARTPEPGSPAHPPSPPSPPSPSTTSFTIAGDVTGLYPGATRSLTLTVTDRRTFPILVTSITTAVGGGRPGCPAADLRVGPFTGGVSVAGEGSAQVVVTVSMLRSAPNACQGAVFPLSYHGTATKP